MATALLLQAGVLPLPAQLQADLLIEAELRGHPSHGLLRLQRLLARISKGLIDPSTSGLHSWNSPSFLDVDGQRGLGPVVAMAALDALAERARTAGVAVAGILNANHLGMLAFYVERFARKGQIVLALSTSEALVHPWGGKRALLGTNPMAIGVPTGGDPFVLDLATGVVSMGKIHHYAQRGEAIPLGWALDSLGNATTDATLAKSGALTPFGAAKGYGIGLAIELLVASLAGSALAPEVRGTLDAEHVANKGDVFIVIDPPTHPGLAQAIDAYLEVIRNSPAQNPARPVSIPGDGARRRRSLALEDGIEIDAQLWASLDNARVANPSPSVLQDVPS